MKFTVLGHACLFVETKNSSLLVDPWLFGSCYWRSWWHYPQAAPIEKKHLSPDYIYLSHHHFDHFHYPSLRKISKQARVLIPKFAVDIMEPEVAGLGFENIHELPHGKKFCIDEDSSLASFQYGTDDSALFIQSDNSVLADLNDCKLKGAAAKDAIKMFGNPTFLFRQFSFAQSFPNCYEFESKQEGSFLTQKNFIDSFTASIELFNPKYSVPFASGAALLHPESQHCNKYSVTEHELKSSIEEQTPHQIIKSFKPGDSWDSESGFKYLKNTKQPSIQQIQKRADRSIYVQNKIESKTKLPFHKFQTFFTDFLNALPFFIRLTIKKPIVFKLENERFGIIDAKSKKVYETSILPNSYGSLVEIQPGILSDAISKTIVNFIHISMRIRIFVPKNGFKSDFCFWGFLTLYELGYFPIKKCFSIRALSVAWHRRKEILEVILKLIKSNGSVLKTVQARMPSVNKTLISIENS